MILRIYSTVRPLTGTSAEQSDDCSALVIESKQEYGENWCMVFDDVLFCYLKNIEDVPNKKQRALVNGYLKSLEILVVSSK